MDDLEKDRDQTSREESAESDIQSGTPTAADGESEMPDTADKENNNGEENAEVSSETILPILQKTQKEESGVVSTIFDYLEIFAFSVCAVVLLFSFAARLCRVNGDSMNQTLKNGQMLLISDVFYTPKSGDIVVFHQTGETLNEPLVKRVIATGGQTVKIDFVNGITYVDGKEIENAYADDTYIWLGGRNSTATLPANLHYYTGSFLFYGGKYITDDGCYERQVPEGMVFVMGDNRNNSKDSRYPEVDMVDERRILGRVVLRVVPFTIFD